MKNIIELKEIASSYSLLYVEDDIELAQTCISYFSKIFKKVIHAENGLEALELYGKNDFELVVTDIKMPKMDGIEMSTKIKQSNPSQNILITSAHSDIKYFMESIKIGIDAYTIKPINYMDLNNVLLKLVKRVQLEKMSSLHEEELERNSIQIQKRNEELSHYTNILNKVAIVSKTDLKGNITYINDLFCEISGYSREELIGASHNIIRHPDMARDIFKQLWETIKAGKVWEGSIKNKSKSGEPYFVYATIIPIYEENNTTIKEYIGVRFLTTKEENIKRNFHKNVILKYQELQQKDFNAKKKIENLEKELTSTNNEDKYLNITNDKLKQKNKKLLEQINFCENELRLTNDNYHKSIGTRGGNVKKTTQDYKKLLLSFESQKKAIIFLSKDDALRKKEIIKLQEKLNEQNVVVHELRDTIKNINDEKKKTPEQKKNFWEK